MNDNEILLGIFKDDKAIEEKLNKDIKYDEKIISYKDKDTNELVIKFVRKPVNNNTK